MRRLALAALVALFAGGCAPSSDAAALEIYLTLPTVPAGRDQPAYYLLQVRDADGHPFTIEWQDEIDVPPLLLGAAALDDHVSVSADGVAHDVHVRVAVCDDPGCDGELVAADQLWFVLERPFFPGVRTEWHRNILDLPAGVPTEPIVVDRCAIRGCVTGSIASDYCLPSGLHPCD